MSASRIAAIVTCRDLGRTLGEALSSLERQTRPPAEIVVVDDASTDLFTRQALARVEREGTRVVHGGGRGASAARNLGARLTRADYLIWLDADDLLEPGYFLAAAGRLDEDPELDFVTCSMQAFGAASYTWSPSEPTFVEAVATGAVPHASTMMRRSLFAAIGGFDESLPSYELLDFWATAIARGARGVVLPEAFLRYRVRAGSGYRRSLQPETYRARMRHFYEKHGESVSAHADALLVRKDAFLLEQRRYRDELEARVGQLSGELAALQREIGDLSARAAARGQARVELGDFRRREPFSTQWGRDRGAAIDRRYIEAFLARHERDVCGRVLEVEEALYTRQFGADRVTQADVIDRDPANPRATIVADLRDAAGIADETYDCIVLTQTLHLVDDMAAVLRTCARLLRPGGVLLVTAPSVIRVDDRAGPDGDFWRLTEASARRLFAEAFPLEAFEVETRGNVMACTAFLYGLSAEELDPADLDADDPAFPLVVTIRAVKPTPAARATSRPAHARATATGAAVVLAYHRVASLVPDSHGLCMPPDLFRAHLTMLRREFTPMALPDLVRASSSGCLPERAVVITLDDGYLDALTAASPVLQELGVPATFFVNSDRLGEPHERDWDWLERALLSDIQVPASLVVAEAGARLEAPTRTREERAAALEALHRLMWPLDAAPRAAIVRAVESWRGGALPPRDTHRVLTGDEVVELSRRPGHTIGSHTVHHLALTTQPLDTRRREVDDDKRALERLLDEPVTVFSYPYGDADAELAGVVSAAGFHAAVTVDAGLVRPGVNRLFLPRVEPAAVPVEILSERLDALFPSR